jgi:hypothetical protein
MIINIPNAYLVLVSLGSGAIGIAISMIEVWYIYRFILNNQSSDFVPQLDETLNQTKKNIMIREFRKKVLLNKEKVTPEVADLRKILRVSKLLIIILLTLFAVVLGVAYLNSK